MGRTKRPFNLLDAIAFKTRGLLMIPPVALIFLYVRWEWEYDPGVWGFGLIVFLPGVILRIWSQRHLRYRVQAEHCLAVTGPYAYCRNPVYVGNMLLLAGLTVLCELIWAVPFIILWAMLVYSRAVRFEEARLAMRFGSEYACYCEGVPRWVPRCRRLTRGTLGTDADPMSWRRAISVEWQCLSLLLVPVLKEWIADLPLAKSDGFWLFLSHSGL